MCFSSDGTAGSIAYSQANILPVIQIASVTGILGITFLLTLFPSAIVFCWYYRNKKKNLQNILVCSSVLLAFTLIYGIIRINYRAETNPIKTGLVVLDEKNHDMSATPDFQKEKLLANKYVEAITLLADQGAKIVVLPERAVNINKKFENDIINVFREAAMRKKIYIVIGYTNFRNEKEYNSALVISDQGDVVTDYRKVHLVTGLERRFEPGSEMGLFKFGGLYAGTAICKDLDFPEYIRNYGKNRISFLFVPAWDFEVDDWLHSRMAILRGVEFGFSEVRSARQGRLTISDSWGRVTSEASSSKGQKGMLTGEVSIYNRKTMYSLLGDWFGILNVIAAIGYILFILIQRKRLSNS
jgi:apolipoprotein N-acyltransferase